MPIDLPDLKNFAKDAVHARLRAAININGNILPIIQLLLLLFLLLL